MIFESRAMAELVMHGRGVPGHLIAVVPLGVDVELFRPAESACVHERLELPRQVASVASFLPSAGIRFRAPRPKWQRAESP